MKITIFEKEHFEGAFPVIKLFDSPGNEISIFTSEETLNRFNELFKNDSSRYQWTVLPTNAGKLRFFYSLYKNLKKQKPDIFYINTISDNHLFYALVLWLLPLKKIVLTVHDINCLFDSRFSGSPRKSIIHLGKRWLTRQVREFNVVSDTMVSYLRSKEKLKGIHNIPGSVFEHKQLAQTVEQPLRIVVPGSLDKRRRNYEAVFELAAIANKERISLKIILLGGYSDAYGKAITIRAKEFESDFCEILFYNIQVVQQDEFDGQMDAAHFVFIPSVIDTKICDNIPEIYGITKSSGNIFDVIKHAKPFIVPSGLSISTQLETSCFKYGTIQDIAGFLKNFIVSPQDYDRWQLQSLANSLNYTIEKIRERNSSLFEKK